MFILWQHALTRLKRDAFNVKKELKNSSEWFKLNERLVSPCYKITSVVLELDLHVSFAPLTLSFLALSAGFHLRATILRCFVCSKIVFRNVMSTDYLTTCRNVICSLLE